MKRKDIATWVGSLLAMTFLLANYSFGQDSPVLEGHAEKTHTIDELRKEALKNTPRHVWNWKEPKLDPNLLENLKARVEKTQCLPNRVLSVLPNGHYGVAFYGESKLYLFTEKGKLLKIAYSSKPALRKSEQPTDYYPIKTTTYTYPSGVLTSIAYSVAHQEGYVFSPAGELQYYCIAEQCYSPSGTPTSKRKITDLCE